MIIHNNLFKDCLIINCYVTRPQIINFSTNNFIHVLDKFYSSYRKPCSVMKTVVCVEVISS